MESDQNFRTEADVVNFRFPAAQPVLQRVTLATTHILTSMGHPTFFISISYKFSSDFDVNVQLYVRLLRAKINLR